MQVLITGAGGMIGGRVARRIARDGTLAGKPVTGVTLVDIVPFAAPASPLTPVITQVRDLADPGAASALMDPVPDVILHLAAVPSGLAEAEFDLGYRANLDGTRALLDAARATRRSPRFVFASTIAVFGPPLPDVIPDDQPLTPLTSYGAQKVMIETMLGDYSRKGHVDGLALRLPTIIVRPDKPNGAASSFYSSILREPMAGQPATLPVRRDLRHWFASPDAAVGYFLHAAGLDTAPLGARRALTMPGLSATIADLIDALDQVSGPGAVDLINEDPDPAIAAIVTPWPRAFAAERARSLGFLPDTDLVSILRQHARDMNGTPPRIG